MALKNSIFEGLVDFGHMRFPDTKENAENLHPNPLKGVNIEHFQINK